MRILLLFTALISLSIFSEPAPAMEINAYLNSQVELVEPVDGEFENISGSNKAVFDFQTYNDTYCTLVSLMATNYFGDKNDGMEKEDEFKLDRAYLELYPIWGTVTIGRQRVSWGKGYLFNLVDLFNPLNPKDPKGDKPGIDAFSTTWYLNETSRTDMLILPEPSLDALSYGAKGQITVGLYDIAANYLKKTGFSPVIRERRAGILEFKGEMGLNAPGVWGQLGRCEDNLASGVKRDLLVWTLGMDYTFPVGNGLYCLVETYYDEDLDTEVENKKVYIFSRYNPESYLTLSIGYLRDLEINSGIYMLNLEHQFNDEIEIYGSYNFCPEGSKVLMPMEKEFNRTREIIIGVKSYF